MICKEQLMMALKKAGRDNDTRFDKSLINIVAWADMYRELCEAEIIISTYIERGYGNVDEQ